ncbi:MAG TPA: hypothetical protein VKZ89_20840 [Thermobifida alba]|nr:hypothetical protein [Thermobifida alba]
MDVTLTELTNADPTFYAILGPYLANHDVHKAIGGVPWDEPTKTWLIASAADGTIAGFAAINHKKRTLLESLYAAGDNPDTIALLVQAAVDRFGHDHDLHTTVRRETADHYTTRGFAVVKTLTNFVTLVRPADVRG